MVPNFQYNNYRKYSGVSLLDEPTYTVSFGRMLSGIVIRELSYVFWKTKDLSLCY
jgi:hypothetical protein